MLCRIRLFIRHGFISPLESKAASSDTIIVSQSQILIEGIHSGLTHIGPSSGSGYIPGQGTVISIFAVPESGLTIGCINSTVIAETVFRHPAPESSIPRIDPPPEFGQGCITGPTEFLDIARIVIIVPSKIA